MRYTAISPMLIPHLTLEDVGLASYFIPKGTQVHAVQYSKVEFCQHKFNVCNEINATIQHCLHDRYGATRGG